MMRADTMIEVHCKNKNRKYTQYKKECIFIGTGMFQIKLFIAQIKLFQRFCLSIENLVAVLRRKLNRMLYF